MKNSIARRRFPLALALLPTLVAGALLSGCSKVPDTIKIGVAQPLSGPLGALGQDLLNGVNLAVKELNRDGFMVDGKRVQLEVVSVDDKAEQPPASKWPSNWWTPGWWRSLATSIRA